MAADITSFYKKPRKEKVAELMLAMEIEQRRKRSLEVESENTEEDQGEGDWFDARQIVIDIKNTEKRSKLDPVMVKAYTTSKPSVKRKTKPFNYAVNSENRKFSNRSKDAIQVTCQICGSLQTCNVLRCHTRNIHGLSITDYKAQFGPLSDHYVEWVFHECGVCGKALPLDPDAIAPHAKSHGMSHREYTARFMILNKESKGDK